MFTGIVEELGAVLSRVDVEDQVVRLRIGATDVLADATLGASIAVNGCCLTVVEFEPAAGGDAGWWEADVSLETLQRTNLGALGDGDPVNLERPVRLQDRLGGHLVQGHVDAVGTIIEPAPDLRIHMDSGLTRYIVEKGSQVRTSHPMENNKQLISLRLVFQNRWEIVVARRNSFENSDELLRRPTARQKQDRPQITIRPRIGIESHVSLPLPGAGFLQNQILTATNSHPLQDGPITTGKPY